MESDRYVQNVGDRTGPLDRIDEVPVFRDTSFRIPAQDVFPAGSDQRLEKEIFLEYGKVLRKEFRRIVRDEERYMPRGTGKKAEGEILGLHQRQGFFP